MSDPKVVAAVLAGGTGNRVGSSVPKTLLQVLGHPLIHYSLRTLQAIPRIAAIRVAIVNRSGPGRSGISGNSSLSSSDNFLR